jgi:putative peptide zinc metalloprotease protein
MARFTTRWGERYAIGHSPASGAYLRFDGDEADVIGACDGSHTVGELVIEGLAGGAPLETEGVVDLVLLLRARHFLEEPPLDVYAAARQRLLRRRQRLAARAWRALRKQTIPIPRADAFTGRVYRLGGRLLFTPAATAVTAILLVVGLAAFVRVAQHGGYSVIGHVSTGTALSLLGLGLVALFIHEMSHALAVRRAGRRVVSAGFQLYLGHPAFFIDSTDLMLAPPRARAVNAMAGPYAEAVAAGMAAIGAWLAPVGSVAVLFRFAGITYLNVLLNLIPFLELDGYWLFSDLLDVPRLRPRSFALLRDELPARLRGRRAAFTPSERGLAAFGVVGLLFTGAALVTAWTFWGPIARRLATATWHGGAGGKAVLVVLLVLIVGPIAHALGGLAAAAARWSRRRLADLRFRLQTSWRVEAVDLITSLPAIAELDDSDAADLAGRVGRRRVRPSEVVVREGSAADAFHVVRAGRFAVTERSADGGERPIRHLGPGEAFGELALLEGRPRTATVRAETAGELFVVDAGTFGRLLAPNLSSPLKAYERSLLEVWALPPFRHLSQGEVAEIAGRGEWVSYRPHETVVRQGELGDRFYVLGAGQAEVVIDRQRATTLRAGDHFGEIALLHAIPRTATVRTLTLARLFSLDAAAFTALLAGAFARSSARTPTDDHNALGAH